MLGWCPPQAGGVLYIGEELLRGPECLSLCEDGRDDDSGSGEGHPRAPHPPPTGVLAALCPPSLLAFTQTLYVFQGWSNIYLFSDPLLIFQELSS